MVAESLATFVGRGMLKAKGKPAPGYPTRKGLDEPTIWKGPKKAGWDPTTLPGMPKPKPPPRPGGSLAAMLGRR